MFHRAHLFVCTLLIVGALGCSERPDASLVLVHGQVTFRGAPLSGGLIVFTPDEDYGGHGPSATGTIGPDGRFTLSTDGAPGAQAGKHRVTIAGPDNWRLPERFLDPQLSRLFAEVIAGQDNAIDFRLEDR